MRDDSGSDGVATVWRWRNQAAFVVVCDSTLDILLLFPFSSFLALIRVVREGVSSVFFFWFSSGCREEDAKPADHMQRSSLATAMPLRLRGFLRFVARVFIWGF
ncbi:hypothetical protein LR48_Vigan10g258100 [Vigna angularis]|uniref:Transmembrane protein n=1 Tax=Phaseolus angularis TaxID=3914 RepID=A0A0L9VPL4_PHAAN|nr:hypothetical protein LR48_Vigan10g258100 [Vigna angularis]